MSDGRSPARSVLVVGGGIGGVQAALDLADAGRRVILVERAGAIGGYMAMLDKTFPTNDCSMCILSPKLVNCARHPNIQLFTLTEVKGITGEPGDFQVELLRYARSVDLSRCTGCGDCLAKCPVKLPNEFEGGLSERRAIYRLYAQAVPNAPVIDRANCLKFTRDRCGNCARVCKAGAIDYTQKDEELVVNVGAIVLAPGGEVVPAEIRPEYSGLPRYPNVVTALEFERILSASGPFGGHIQRPSDRRQPKKVAWVQCFGSRDETVGRGYCSSVCCMYAVKEAVIAKEHAREIEPTVFYMDMRAFGKDFDRYIERAERQYGVRFVRARVAEVREEPDTRDMVIRYSTDDGQCSERFDMVVLSCGFLPGEKMVELNRRIDVLLNEYSYPVTEMLEPLAAREGVFIAGAGLGPRDIPETVISASGAAARSLRLVPASPAPEVRTEARPEPGAVYDTAPRIGVFVCHCGINIGGVVRVPEVVEYARNLPGVVYAEENLYSCSADTLEKIKVRIREHRLNRVVVASCSPRTHEVLFQATVAEAGLSPHLFAMANIRDQCSWVHMEEPDRATEKAKDLVRMAVARVRRQEPLQAVRLPVEKAALVLGGGVSGMAAALALADAGFPVYLVEREAELGGNARSIVRTIEGKDVRKLLAEMKGRVLEHPQVRVYTNTRVREIAGFVGAYETTLESGERLRHGVVIVATGAQYRTPEEYLYGKTPSVKTQKEFEELLEQANGQFPKSVVMIQCVGSREGERNYCSRICCVQAIKNAITLKERSPETDVYILYRDIRTYGFRERYYRRARELGVVFIRYEKENKPKVELADGQLCASGTPAAGQLRVTVYEPILKTELELHPELLVLSSGLIARPESAELARMLKVPLHPDGFFLEAHAKLRPVDFATDGVFLCGLAHYPKFIDEAVASAQAAAGRAATVLERESVSAEPYQAVVNTQRCSACHMCERLCPYRAIEVKLVDERGGRFAAVVNPALCKGCGACAANCRSEAIDIKGFTSDNIVRELRSLFEE